MFRKSVDSFISNQINNLKFYLWQTYGSLRVSPSKFIRSKLYMQTSIIQSYYRRAYSVSLM